MAQTNVNIRMDDNLKQQFECLCGELGMNMSTAFNIFAKAMVRKQGIPFEVALDPFYSESNMKVLEQRIANIESGKSVPKEHKLIEVQDMGVLWEDEAWEEYLGWQEQDKKMLKRINRIVKDIQRNPFDGIGHPEPLSENLSGWWSRRIDDKNRIVYKPTGNNTIILSCRGHYDDK